MLAGAQALLVAKWFFLPLQPISAILNRSVIKMLRVFFSLTTKQWNRRWHRGSSSLILPATVKPMQFRRIAYGLNSLNP